MTAHPEPMSVLILLARSSVEKLMLRAGESEELALSCSLGLPPHGARANFDVAVAEIVEPAELTPADLGRLLRRSGTAPLVLWVHRFDPAWALEAIRAGVSDIVDVRKASYELLSCSLHSAVVRRDRRSPAKGRAALLPAHTDSLTGLPNRQWLDDNLDTILSSAPTTSVGILFLDLDGFKQVNDSLGHSAGDRLLVDIATELCRSSRCDDTVVRLGGDEFVIILTSTPEQSAIAKAAENVLRVVRRPVEVAGRVRYVTGTIGIAVSGRDGSNSEVLLQRADMAMYHAKKLGRARYAFYADKMTQETEDRSALVQGLREALVTDSLSLVYQPQIDSRGGGIVGVEALVRWQHPERGLVAPSQFVTLAEQCGLAEELGSWVLNHALEEAALLWALKPDLRIAVNVSAHQIHALDFPETVASALARTHTRPDLLELELTETAVLSSYGEAERSLSSLREIGVRLALDDFGTGYSSLRALWHVPIQKLKIDRGFVSQLARDRTAQAIVLSILHLTSSKGIEAIAEGVETLEQARMLLDFGCYQMQGFLFGQPEGVEAVASWLAEPDTPWTGPLAALEAGWIGKAILPTRSLP